MHEDSPATGRTMAYGFKSDFQFNSFAMHDSNIGKRIAQFGNGDLLLKKDSSDSSFKRGGNAENRELLLRCAGYWNLLGKIRSERRRNLRYKYGDQWGDYIEDPDNPGKTVREEVLISRHGRIPLKHNFIQQYIRNIMGQQLSNNTQSVVYARSEDDTRLSEMLTNTLQAVNKLNETDKLDMAVFEELLLAGIAVVKVRFDYWSTRNRFDGKLELVNINRFFFNTDIEDPRFSDIRLVGEIHDYTMDELLKNFARSRRDEEELRGIYGNCDRNYIASCYGMESRKLEGLDFLFNDASSSKCRVIEVWEKRGRWVTYVHDYSDGTEQIIELGQEEIDRINRERIAACEAKGIVPDESFLLYAEPRFEHYWSVRFLTPDGVCIKEMETPYLHEEHPYVFAMLPMVDGEIKSGIGDLIDMQRYINRLIVMIDFIMGASAKGVLMVPESAIPDGYSVEDFTNEYVKANGVIVYKPTATREVPFQISSNSTNVGAWEMLQLQMGLIEKISGVSGAIQGQSVKSGTPSSLYAQQAQNSMINLKVLFTSFNLFLGSRDEKLLKVLMQYYTERRYVDIAGKSYTETAKYYDPDMARKITDFNFVVSQSSDTPVFRQIADDMLLGLLQSGQIPLEIYLNNTSMPFAQKLLSDLKQAQEAEMQQEQGVQTGIGRQERG